VQPQGGSLGLSERRSQSFANRGIHSENAQWSLRETPGSLRETPMVSPRDPGVSPRDRGVSPRDPGVPTRDSGVSPRDPWIPPRDLISLRISNTHACPSCARVHEAVPLLTYSFKVVTLLYVLTIFKGRGMLQLCCVRLCLASWID